MGTACLIVDEDIPAALSNALTTLAAFPEISIIGKANFDQRIGRKGAWVVNLISQRLPPNWMAEDARLLVEYDQAKGCSTVTIKGRTDRVALGLTYRTTSGEVRRVKESNG